MLLLLAMLGRARLSQPRRNDAGERVTDVASARFSRFKSAARMADYHWEYAGRQGTEQVAMTDEDLPLNAAAGFDSSSAMVRADSDYLDATLHALVKRLSSVPGLNMTVA